MKTLLLTSTLAALTLGALPAFASDLGDGARLAGASAFADGSFGDDVNPADNSATELTPLDAAPDLRLTKALAGARPTVGPGEQGLYRLAYSNVGAQTATGVVVTETVPANTTFSAAGSSAGWSCADGAAAGTACTFPVGKRSLWISSGPIGPTTASESRKVGGSG